MLREADLIQVDMTGFTAITGYTRRRRSFCTAPSRVRRAPSASRCRVLALPDTSGSSRLPPRRPSLEFGGEAVGAVRRDEPFILHTPRGARPFTLLVAGCSQYGAETAAILDVHRGRVLLAITEPTVAGGSSVEDEMAAAVRLAWPEFVRYVNAHDKRRYPLEP